jgi:hypothetical protein
MSIEKFRAKIFLLGRQQEQSSVRIVSKGNIEEIITTYDNLGKYYSGNQTYKLNSLSEKYIIPCDDGGKIVIGHDLNKTELLNVHPDVEKFVKRWTANY